jgi:uracil-DNA glycosylase
MSSMYFPDEPKLLRIPAACAARREQLAEGHVSPLRDFVAELRSRTGKVTPEFDPWDGGIRAKVLYLLEAPGRRAVGSGFVSRNNPDETAKNFFILNREAGIARRDSVIWNVVPWYIGDEQRIRAARTSDVREGTESLAKLLLLFSDLRAIVLVGRKAERAMPMLNNITLQTKVFACPHPSPVFVNRSKGNRDRILQVLLEVAEHLYDTEEVAHQYDSPSAATRHH